MNKVINISKKDNIKEFDALIVGGGGSGLPEFLGNSNFEKNTSTKCFAIFFVTTV